MVCLRPSPRLCPACVAPHPLARAPRCPILSNPASRPPSAFRHPHILHSHPRPTRLCPLAPRLTSINAPRPLIPRYPPRHKPLKSSRTRHLPGRSSLTHSSLCMPIAQPAQSRPRYPGPSRPLLHLHSRPSLVSLTTTAKAPPPCPPLPLPQIHSFHPFNRATPPRPAASM